MAMIQGVTVRLTACKSATSHWYMAGSMSRPWPET